MRNIGKLGTAPSKDSVVDDFGKAIALIHERTVRQVQRTLEKLDDPKTDHDRAIAAYYSDMTRDRLIVSLAQKAIEGTLHDLFFLFSENEEFKLTLKTEAGREIDLAREIDVIQAFPDSWIKQQSSAGSETSRQTEFMVDKLNLSESRQERRARILAMKDQP